LPGRLLRLPWFGFGGLFDSAFSCPFAIGVRPLQFEFRENRRLLATVTWTRAGDGSTGAIQEIGATGSLPRSADDVVINSATAPIIYGAGTDTIHSLNSANALTLVGGTVTVSSTVMVSSTFTLSGGTPIGVTIASGATIDGTLRH
jgi:hypothetical protein